MEPARLAELRNEAPHLERPGRRYEGLQLPPLVIAAVEQVKATYLRIGKPRSLRAAGVIFLARRTAWGRHVADLEKNQGLTPSCGSPWKAGMLHASGIHSRARPPPPPLPG